MRYLKLGVEGLDVERWANFLIGIRPCSTLVVSKEFNISLKDETKLFQRSIGLDPDGSVGPLTLAEAMKIGFNPLVDGDLNNQLGPNWPPKPKFASMNYLERTKIFGVIPYVAAPTQDNPEAIRILGSWKADNITNVTLPQLANVASAPKNLTIEFNSKCVTQLVGLFDAWQQAGLIHLIINFGGSFVPRFIRGSRTTLSNHAWGTAFDININWNYLGSQPALKGTKGSVRELVPIANEFGWGWGGHYPTRPDGMHFEVAKIL